MDTKISFVAYPIGETRVAAEILRPLAEMNDAMVSNINACVKEDDVLYHVGDLVMGFFENVVEFRARLHCKNIHLILGNHDSQYSKRSRWGSATV